MRVPSILLWLGCSLALAACPDNDDDDDHATREQGDLGRGRFVYGCFNDTDSACADGDAELPSALAVGSRFDLQFLIDSGPRPRVIAPATDLVRAVNGGFQVEAAGEFALLAVNGNSEVIDIKHLRGAEIEEVRVQKKSELPASTLQLLPQERAQLSAAPFDGRGVKLGGALGYVWSSSDEQLLTVESLPALNRVQVRAGRGTGKATLSVELGDSTYSVNVQIGSGASEPDAGTIEPDAGVNAPDAAPADAGAALDASADAQVEEDASTEEGGP